MFPNAISRRSLLQAIAATLGASVHVSRPDAAQLLHDAHSAAHVPSGAVASFLSAAEAADVEAIAAQIIPSDPAAPGAREAGVVHFIDRALSTFLAQLGETYRTQLTGFQAAFRAAHPEAGSFAALPSAQQVEYLKSVDQTPFFEATRLLTLLGMFSSPAYGGNHEGAGWKLIGFEDRHAFQPPFGHYDREYTGFVPDAP